MNTKSFASSYVPWFPEQIQAMLREGKDPHKDLVELFMTNTAIHATSEQRRAIVESHYRISNELISPHSTQDILSFCTEILSLTQSRPGCVVEAGCFKGSSTAKFSLAAALAGRPFVVFDSFMGLPAHNEDHGISIEGREVIFREGEFCGSLEEVKANVEKYGDITICEFVPGWFSETMRNWSRPVATAFLDVDLLLSTRECLRCLYPCLVPGGNIYSQDGHLPLILELLEDEQFWREELNTEPPILEGIRKGKLIKITRPFM
ncbi:hypothetical protein HGO41_21650 [Rahnella sp. CG8]|uniref:TylF/MycF family methyltransferase n=1 Tax=Rahnella sp. CG8 TaxID=2726078 RepID=UPI002033F856|nr:TylF/MycF family methyltransferase [Rahnella sp. CG8]MCM2447766.1 hypothetical protein [Rahnella sp. CG8]